MIISTPSFQRMCTETACFLTVISSNEIYPKPAKSVLVLHWCKAFAISYPIHKNQFMALFFLKVSRNCYHSEIFPFSLWWKHLCLHATFTYLNVTWVLQTPLHNLYCSLEAEKYPNSIFSNKLVSRVINRRLKL